MNVEAYEKARTEYLAADKAYSVATQAYFVVCEAHNVAFSDHLAWVTHDPALAPDEVRIAGESLTAAREAYYTTARAAVAALNELGVVS
jgi:hypothetical protein